MMYADMLQLPPHSLPARGPHSLRELRQRPNPLASVPSALDDRVATPDVSDLYTDYRQNVYRFICRRVRDRNEAEDLTQETFLQAHRSAHLFEGRSSTLSWLLGIARYTCLRHLRHSGRWMIGADAVDDRVEKAVDSRTESRVDAIRQLERCGEIIHRYRSRSDGEIFRLRYGQQETICEIANQVGKSKGAIKGSLHRSRRLIEEHVSLPRIEPLHSALQ